MRTYRDAKAMAKTLREALAHKQVTLSHSESLELVAHQLGLASWNVLAARLKDTGPRFEPAIPLLRILSVEPAREFYEGFLGFTLDWEHRFAPDLPWYAQLSRAGATLHLSEHHGDGSPGTVVFVPMTGLDELHRGLLATQYRYARPGIEEVPWGRVLAVTDPFHNTLRFCER